jgi:hypothetical protein
MATKEVQIIIVWDGKQEVYDDIDEAIELLQQIKPSEPSPEQDAEIVELNRAIVIKVEQCAAKDAEIERLKREIALLESQKRII